MLNDKDAVATVAVKDLNSAKRFYEQTLRSIIEARYSSRALA